ncbi:hypothetical protein [Burkholderia ubonensis]|uniref:hypothetical protein n=1 Tax=Burkholderia ubonensis TaxID=101571 RepID=UPI000AC46135|nr:hypothetical protein [Burkholderia ubonensis]
MLKVDRNSNQIQQPSLPIPADKIEGNQQSHLHYDPDTRASGVPYGDANHHGLNGSRQQVSTFEQLDATTLSMSLDVASQLPLGPSRTYSNVIFGTDGVRSPDASLTQEERIQRANDFDKRVEALIFDMENGSESEKNVKFLSARPFMEPHGYFTGGLMAAGYDPNEEFTVTFHHRRGVGGTPTSPDETTTRVYTASDISAGRLEHDIPAYGGIVNFNTVSFESEQQVRIEELRELGRTLQANWQENVFAQWEMNTELRRRSGEADVYGLESILKNLQADAGSFGKLSPEGQQALNQVLDGTGQVIIPNIYGYPLAKHAFIPYQDYDENGWIRPNSGLLIDLDQGGIAEIGDDEDFARYAKSHRPQLLNSLNAEDLQGWKDVHWPQAREVLDDLIAGKNTYKGYTGVGLDGDIPSRELFNYTNTRWPYQGSYGLKVGKIRPKDGGVNLAALYSKINLKNAESNNKTQVFGLEQQNWKAAEEVWGNTFGYLPIVGNVGNIVFGAHNGIRGMTAEDRQGGNIAAVVGSLQLAHEVGMKVVERMAVAQSGKAMLPNGSPKGVHLNEAIKFNYNHVTGELKMGAPQATFHAGTANDCGLHTIAAIMDMNDQQVINALGLSPSTLNHFIAKGMDIDEFTAACKIVNNGSITHTTGTVDQFIAGLNGLADGQRVAVGIEPAQGIGHLVAFRRNGSVIEVLDRQIGVLNTFNDPGSVEKYLRSIGAQNIHAWHG